VSDTILIVDDDEGVREILTETLKSAGHSVSGAESGERAVAAVREAPVDLVILDMVLPQVDGLEVLREITTLRPETAVIMITGYASVETAIRAMKMGAVDYIVKPFRMEEVELIVSRALERSRLRRENAALRRQIQMTWGLQNLVGQSPEIRRIQQLVEQVASARSAALITGAAGSGKELVARAIHFGGERRGQPFVPVSCAGIPDALLEDEIFGHVRGAFPEALSDRQGRIAAADGGTLFLDEVSGLSSNLQARLLRVLQEREVHPIGADAGTPVDVRVIAASTADLKALVAEGRFREDLFYRLSVIHVSIPALKDRREDIPLLAQHVLARCCREMNVPLKRFSSEALRILGEATWPGNVRQLENVVERCVALSFGRDELGREDLPRDILDETRLELPVLRVGGDGFSLDEVLANYEQRMLYQALEHSGWVKTRAAEMLKIKRTTLIEKMKRLGIPLKGNVPTGGEVVAPELEMADAVRRAS
jgi:two-component system, NtrC family, response regulator AtoC